MLNRVHPETGLRLNESYEQRRSQTWALEYEREQNRIHCEQRLKSTDEREKNMPRNMAMAFKANEQEFSRAEKMLVENSPEILENHKNAEWKILKEFQRDERLGFVAQGKLEFAELRNEIFQEVKEEVRPRWAEFYEARKNGLDRETLAEMKTQLIADQKAMPEPLRDAACRDLREGRDERYRELLDGQKEDRAELRWRQEMRLEVAPFFQELEGRRTAAQEIRFEFAEAGHEVADRRTGSAFAPGSRAADRVEDGDGSGVRFDPTGGLGAGLASFADALFFDLTTLGSAKPVPMSAEERADLFREPDEARKSSENARRSIYEIAARECELLREVLAKDCHIEQVSSTIGREFGRQQQQDGFSVNGSLNLSITVK